MKKKEEEEEEKKGSHGFVYLCNNDSRTLSGMRGDLQDDVMCLFWPFFFRARFAVRNADYGCL